MATINEEEKNLIAEIERELESELCDYFGKHPFNLLRWIRGWNGDLKEILPRLRRHLELRRCLKLDEIQNQSYLQGMAESQIHFYPTGLAGVDRDGNVISIEPLGRCDVRGLMPTGRSSEFIRRRIYDCEYSLFLVRQQELKRGHQCGMFLILDMEGLTLDQIWMPAMNVYITIISLMQEHYPELLQKLYLVNCGAPMKVAFNIIQPFLARKTKDKIHMAGSNWKEKLLKEIDDPKNLPVHWGGAYEGKFGEFGDVHMGGKVPSSLRWSPRKNDPKEDELFKLNVPRSDRTQLAFNVDEIGRKLQWFFKMPAHDVEFGIFFVDDKDPKQGREMVMPKLKIDCQHVPEYGTLECDRPGTYVFEFDNSYSWMRSKTILYKIDVI